MANTGKSSRRSRRRRRQRPRNKDAEIRHSKPKASPRQNQQTDKGDGELPQAFIYTYTIYKALD